MFLSDVVSTDSEVLSDSVVYKVVSVATSVVPVKSVQTTTLGERTFVLLLYSFLHQTQLSLHTIPNLA